MNMALLLFNFTFIAVAYCGVV